MVKHKRSTTAVATSEISVEEKISKKLKVLSVEQQVWFLHILDQTNKEHYKKGYEDGQRDTKTSAVVSMPLAKKRKRTPCAGTNNLDFREQSQWNRLSQEDKLKKLKEYDQARVPNKMLTGAARKYTYSFLNKVLKCLKECHGNSVQHYVTAIPTFRNQNQYKDCGKCFNQA